MSKSWMRSTMLLPIVWSLTACAAVAQTVDTVSPQASLECFIESREAGLAGSECPEGVVPAEAIAVAPVRYGPSVVSIVVTGLEDIALSSDNHSVRLSAVSWLGVLGLADQESGRPLPGSVPRLVGIYDRTTDSDSRDLIIKLMIQQEERPAAVAFLADVASTHEAGEAGQFSLAVLAVGALSKMGPEGAAELRELHSEGAVIDRRAKARLEELAEVDFQVKQ
jgi:hypothetical protein